MISEERWQTLEKAAQRGEGTAWSRVEGSLMHDLFVAVEQPGLRRSLWYDVNIETWDASTDLPILRSIQLSARSHSEHAVRLILELQEPTLNSVFRALTNDITVSIINSQDEAGGLQVFLDRLERWRQLLKGEATRGLSATERRGLVGELHVLQALLLNGVDARAAVSRWTGPYGKHQDYQGPTAAVEVKATVVKQPQALIINSERELDDTGVSALYLCHLSLDERQGGTGASLNDMADEVREQIAASAGAHSAFEEALLHCGYLPDQRHLYVEPRYSLRERNAYRVEPGFPSVVESSLPDGVGDVRYRIQISALKPFRADFEKMLHDLGGA